MGFLIHGFPVGFLRPGGKVKLYFSVPVELYTELSNPPNLTKNPGQQSGKHTVNILSNVRPKAGQHLANICSKPDPTSGHADHALKT